MYRARSAKRTLVALVAACCLLSSLHFRPVQARQAQDDVPPPPYEETEGEGHASEKAQLPNKEREVPPDLPPPDLPPPDLPPPDLPPPDLPPRDERSEGGPPIPPLPDLSKSHSAQHIEPDAEHARLRSQRAAYESYRVVHEEEHVSLAQNVGRSFQSVQVGIVLFILGVLLLWWNEGRAVASAGMWAKAAKIVESYNSSALSGAHVGKLIHTTGQVASQGTDPLRDEEFSVSVPDAIKLKRVVEVYQWRQRARSTTTKNTGGSSTVSTTYTCEKVWAEALENSAEYKSQPVPPNPQRKHVESMSISAKDVLLDGKVQLSDSQLSQINAWSDVQVSDASMKKLANATGLTAFRLGPSTFHLGSLDQRPEIGDYRVTYSAASPCVVSVVTGLREGGGGSQANLQFAPFSLDGETVSLFAMGSRSKQQMLDSAVAGNVVTTFVLRAVGWLLLYAAINSMAAPLMAVADIIPFIGSIVGWGIGWSAALIACLLWLVVVAIAWLYYRPLYGLALLGAAAGLLWYLQEQQAQQS